MLGWIFFKLHWGGVSKRSAGAEAQSLLLAIVYLLNLKKNGADAIKTESITDGIFLRVAPEKFRSFIARSSLDRRVALL